MRDLLGPLCALLASCTWALGVSAYTRLGRQVHPWTINATRSLIAVVSFGLLFVVIYGRDAGATLGSVPARQVWLLAISMLMSYALGDLLFLRSAALLGPSAALAIASIYPLEAALVGAILRAAWPSIAGWVGLGAVVAGTALVILSARAEADATATALRRGKRATLLGVALALATSALWAGNVHNVAEGSRGLHR